MELAVIGAPTFTLGFRLAGVRKTHDAQDAAALNEGVHESLRDPEVGIVVMETADLMKLDPALRRDLEKSVRPTLVSIGVEEDTGLRDKLKQALGVDLWK